MSSRNEAELIAAMAKLTAYVELQHKKIQAANETATRVMGHFIALTRALTPLMIACPDPDVLETFRDALVRIDREVQKLVSEADAFQDVPRAH